MEEDQDWNRIRSSSVITGGIKFSHSRVSSVGSTNQPEASNPSSVLKKSVSTHSLPLKQRTASRSRNPFSFAKKLITRKQKEEKKVELKVVQPAWDFTRTLSTIEYTYRTLSLEDRAQLQDDIWVYLTGNVLPIFRMDPLKIPLEDINRLWKVYKNIARDAFGELNEFLTNSLLIMESQVVSKADSQESEAEKLCATWQVFYHHVLYNTLGCFAFDMEKVRSLLILAFRNVVLMSYYEDHVFEQRFTESEKRVLTQCLGVLIVSETHIEDYNQRILESLLDKLRS